MQTPGSTLLRTEGVELVATTLHARASRLSRLLLRSGSRELTRTELGLLSTLAEGPRRITQLADTEAVSQPAISKLIDKLADRGLVARARSEQDGRVVLVSLTAEGLVLLRSVREQTQAVLRRALADLGDDDLGTLVAAGDVLEQLIRALSGEAANA